MSAAGEANARTVPTWAVGGAIGLAVLAVTYLLVQQRSQRHALRAAALISISPDSWTETDPRAAIVDTDRVIVAWSALARDAKTADHIGLRALSPVAHAAGDVREVSVPGRSVASPSVSRDGNGGVWLFFAATAEDSRLYATHAARGGLEFAPPRELNLGSGYVIDGMPRAALAGGQVRVVARATKDKHARIVVVNPERPDANPVVAVESDGLLAMRPAICASETRTYLTWLDPQIGVVLRSSDTQLALDDFSEKSEIVVSKADGLVGAEGPSCQAVGADVTVLYGLAARGFAYDDGTPLLAAVVARSTDEGRTFSARTEIREPGLLILHPAMALDPSGAVVSVYYAARDAVKSPGALRWTRVPAVGGPPNEPREVRAPIFMAAAKIDERYVGDRLGLSVGDGLIATAFIDNSEGVPHVGFAVLGP